MESRRRRNPADSERNAKVTSQGPQTENSRSGVRPPFVVVLLVLFGVLILVGLGQWDWALAGLIGVILGISLLGIFGR